MTLERATFSGHGRTGKRWRKLHANLRAQRQACWLCGQPIDYSLAWPDPGSFSADHRQPISSHPHLAEDPGNLAASHLGCNSSRGNKPPPPTLGKPSRQW